MAGGGGGGGAPLGGLACGIGYIERVEGFFLFLDCFCFDFFLGGGGCWRSNGVLCLLSFVLLISFFVFLSFLRH